MIPTVNKLFGGTVELYETSYRRFGVEWLSSTYDHPFGLGMRNFIGVVHLGFPHTFSNFLVNEIAKNVDKQVLL